MRFLIATALALTLGLPALAQEESLAKLGPNAVPVTADNGWLRNNPAPDYWAFNPFVKPQVTTSACSVAAITAALNGLSGLPAKSEDTVMTQQQLLDLTANADWAKLSAEGGDGVTFDQLVGFAKAALTARQMADYKVDAFHPAVADAEAGKTMRALLTANEASATDALLVYFNQGVVTGDWDGPHVALIGAYDATADRVLVLEVDQEWYIPLLDPGRGVAGRHAETRPRRSGRAGGADRRAGAYRQMTVSLADLGRVFGRIGLVSFGGPAAQIALMHRELVDSRRWLTEAEFLQALSFCMLLPGPEAMQLATWCGWKLQGLRGGLLAGLLFLGPGAVLVLGLAMAYAAWGQMPLTAALFVGVQAAVVVIVFEALLRVSRRALKTRAHWAIAGLAFLALFAFDLPFPLVLLAAAGAGALLGAAKPPADRPPPLPSPPGLWRQTLRTALIWTALWLLPLALLWLWPGGLLLQIGQYFAKLALLTFGGAYAVLAWMAQAVVADLGWLQPRQMIDALGLAETTPGPLILVTEFVAFLAAQQQGGMAYGMAAALLTLWVTFVPSFLFIFTAAPHLARLMAVPQLAAALAGITAAVVGVIANLGLWFAAHAAFGRVGHWSAGPLHLIAPDLSSLNPVSLGLSLLALWLLGRWHWGILPTLGLCALLSGGISLLAIA
ncbi:chromate efflux transporter [Rhodobacter ferrooxidans]